MGGGRQTVVPSWVVLNHEQNYPRRRLMVCVSEGTENKHLANITFLGVVTETKKAALMSSADVKMLKGCE